MYQSGKWPWKNQTLRRPHLCSWNGIWCSCLGPVVVDLFDKCDWSWIPRPSKLNIEKQCKQCTASYACIQMYVKHTHCHIRTMSQHASISTHWGPLQEMSQHCLHCQEPLLSELRRLGISNAIIYIYIYTGWFQNGSGI